MAKVANIFSMQRGSALLVAGLMFLATSGLPAVSAPAKKKANARTQAVLKVSGRFLPNSGGLEVQKVSANGPAANLRPADGSSKTRTILEKGDIITRVEGRPFKDEREFLDLLNEAYKSKNGRVRITVRDPKNNRGATFLARPVTVEMKMPPKLFDLANEIGAPVPAAPFPAVVPPVLAP